MNDVHVIPSSDRFFVVRALAAALLMASCGPPRADDQPTPTMDASDVPDATNGVDTTEPGDAPDEQATDAIGLDTPDEGAVSDAAPSPVDAVDGSPGTQPSGPLPDPERCPDGTYFTPNVTVESPATSWAARISRIEAGEASGTFVLTVQLFDAEGEWGTARQGLVTIEGASGTVESTLTETSLGGVYTTDAALAPPEGDVWTLRVELTDEPVDVFVFVFCRGDA